MKTIKKGSKGVQVSRWQYFLAGLGYTYIHADGKFGKLSHKATVAFQSEHGLEADGIVGRMTYMKAFELGYNLNESRDFPPKPEFRPLVGNASRARIFGNFNYKPADDGSDSIVIIDNWAKENIVPVEIPQLRGVRGAPRSGKIYFHRLAKNQLAALWQEWEDKGLLDRVQSYAGSYVPRFVRGRRGTLSNHAFGSAFDINVPENGLGREPALVGQKGCVRELVESANKHGFYWGGHFRRKDGMHFEVAEIK